jgi:hypothetical protein
MIVAVDDPAAAVITHAPTAQPISDALTVASVSPATYTVIAGSGQPNGTSDSPLAGFPTHGTAFGILTTGDVNSADDPNTIGFTSTNNLQSSVRGTDTVFDLSVMRIDGLRGGAGCRLSFDYRFLSEEFPEYVGSGFNDVFVAELDQNSWTSSGGAVAAPDAFVVQSVDTSPMQASEAAGTTYDGATVLLTASVPLPQSVDRSLFLSIADLGDSSYDSAVFIDKLGVICPAHITIHRFPFGTRLLASPPGWSCIDVNTNLVVVQGATLAQPNSGVSCTPPTNDAYCRSVVAGGYHAWAGTGSMTLTSTCTTTPTATQTLQLPFNAGVSTSSTGIGLFPWRCQMNDGTIGPDADVWMFCKVNTP